MARIKKKYFNISPTMHNKLVKSVIRPRVHSTAACCRLAIKKKKSKRVTLYFLGLPSQHAFDSSLDPMLNDEKRNAVGITPFFNHTHFDTGIVFTYVYRPNWYDSDRLDTRQGTSSRGTSVSQSRDLTFLRYINTTSSVTWTESGLTVKSNYLQLPLCIVNNTWTKVHQTRGFPAIVNHGRPQEQAHSYIICRRSIIKPIDAY